MYTTFESSRYKIRLQIISPLNTIYKTSFDLVCFCVKYNILKLKLLIIKVSYHKLDIDDCTNSLNNT